MQIQCGLIDEKIKHKNKMVNVERTEREIIKMNINEGYIIGGTFLSNCDCIFHIYMQATFTTIKKLFTKGPPLQKTLLVTSHEYLY